MNAQRFVVRASMREAGLGALAILLLFALRLYQSWDVIERGGEGWWALPHLMDAGLLGFALLGTVFYLVARKPIVTIGPEGIAARSHSGEVIPWAAIAAAWQENDRTLCLQLRDPARYPPSSWHRWQRKPQGAHIVVRLDHAKDRFEGLINAVSRFAPRLL